MCIRDSFTIEQIKKKCEKEEFISNSEGYHFDESKFDDFDTAKTVYIGAGKSGLSYRFYDTDKEVCSRYNKTLDEVGSWKRTEKMCIRDRYFIGTICLYFRANIYYHISTKGENI